LDLIAVGDVQGDRLRNERGPVPRQGEVSDPGGVVDAGHRRPRRGDAGAVPGGPQLADLREELRDGESGV
jgi:hypothetical protein